MATSKLTSKGQITIPREIRDHLNLEAGDKVDFMVTQDGKVQVRALERPLDDLYGFLRQPGAPAVSLEEMDAAVVEGRAADHERIRGTRGRDRRVREDEG